MKAYARVQLDANSTAFKPKRELVVLIIKSGMNWGSSMGTGEICLTKAADERRYQTEVQATKCE